MSSNKARPSRYSPHPSIAHARAIVANMREKTGRTLEEWIALVTKRGPKEESTRAEWLKKVYGLGANYAGWIAARSSGRNEEDTDPEKYLARAEEYVDEQYGADRAGLRPIYERLLELGLALGEDVKACPCKNSVPLFRKHAIAEIKPVARERLDLGLALGKYTGKLSPRLVDTGGKARKDRITHRIELSSPEDVDPEVERWLNKAYDLDG
jgi:hypothetical protein